MPALHSVTMADPANTKMVLSSDQINKLAETNPDMVAGIEPANRPRHVLIPRAYPGGEYGFRVRFAVVDRETGDEKEFDDRDEAVEFLEPKHEAEPLLTHVLAHKEKFPDAWTAEEPITYLEEDDYESPNNRYGVDLNNLTPEHLASLDTPIADYVRATWPDRIKDSPSVKADAEPVPATPAPSATFTGTAELSSPESGPEADGMSDVKPEDTK